MVTVNSLMPTVARDLSDDEVLAHYPRPDRQEGWLRANFVSSVDGAVTVDGLSAGLGSAADHRVFDLLRRLADVVLVAAGTVRAEGYGPMRLDEESAAARISSGLAGHPVFAIVSASLDLDPSSPIFTDAPVRPIVVTTSASPAERRAALEKVADVMVCGAERLDVTSMREQLAHRGLRAIHCEGGPSLFGTLIEADAIDELCLTLSPLVVAGGAGRISTSTVAASRRLALASILESDGTLLLRYTRA